MTGVNNRTLEVMKKLLIISVVILFLFCIVIQAHAGGCGFIEIKPIGRYELSYGKAVNEHQHIAKLYKVNGAQTVGNHYGSQSETGGQWKLENLRVGDKAYLEYYTANGTQIVHHSGSYTCYAVFICDVIDGHFYHKGKEVKPYEETDLICCTCVGHDSSRNYVAFFEVMK